MGLRNFRGGEVEKFSGGGRVEKFFLGGGELRNFRGGGGGWVENLFFLGGGGKFFW